MGNLYLIEPGLADDKASRNCLRVEFIDPQPRCIRKPRNAMAWLALNKMPWIIKTEWQNFGYCSGKENCGDCPVAKECTCDARAGENKKEFPAQPYTSLTSCNVCGRYSAFLGDGFEKEYEQLVKFMV
jgi:hypothetical protein